MNATLNIFIAIFVTVTSFLTTPSPALAETCKFQTAKQLKSWMVKKSKFKGRWKGGTRRGAFSFTITPDGMLESDGQGSRVTFVNGKSFKYHGGKSRGPVTYEVTSSCRLVGIQHFPRKGGGYWIVTLNAS